MLLLYTSLFGILFLPFFAAAKILKKAINEKKVAILACIVVFISYAFLLYYYLSIKKVPEALEQILYLITYILFSLDFIYVALSITYIITKEYYDNVRSQAIRNQIKNDTADYFVSTNKKGKIVEYSKSISLRTHLNKKQITCQKGAEFILKHFDIIRFNNTVYSTDVKRAFLCDLEEYYKSKDPVKVSFEAKDNGKNNCYNLIIYPIYARSHFVGANFFIYQDKMSFVSDATKSLKRTTDLLVKHKEVLNILMSLSEGVALYYDYQEKVYYATEAFKSYLGSKKDYYTFQELFDLILEEDLENYIEETKTINSKAVTRIKYRMNLRGELFNIIEDSIYLSDNSEELASIIHITGRSDIEISEQALSTKETIDLLSSLAQTPVDQILDRVLKIFESSKIGEQSEK